MESEPKLAAPASNQSNAMPKGITVDELSEYEFAEVLQAAQELLELAVVFENQVKQVVHAIASLVSS